MLVLSDRSFLASSVHHPGTSLVAQGRRQQPFLRSKTRIAFKRLLQQCRAGKQPPPDGAGGGKGKPGSGQDVEATLKQLGIDRPTARKVLQVWRQAGVTDAATLQELLRKRGATRSAAVALQLAVDAFSGGIAWWTGFQIAQTHSFGPFSLAVEYATYTLACYITLAVFLDASTLVAVGVATKRYSANSASFLAAIQAMAGESGLQVVDKARRAALTVKIISAMEQILRSLQERAASSDPADFFRDLSSYLTLQQARERAGFDPASVGLSPADAADIAASFAEVDSNGDGRIDFAEFRQLCGRYAPELSAEESEAAMTVLTKANSIDFPEWVKWWQGKGGPAAVRTEGDQAARQ